MINVAVVGTGNISPLHLSGFLAHPGLARIVALCDLVPAKAEAKRAAFGLDGVGVHAHIDQVLARDDVDLVAICTPPSTHAELAIAALRAGKHVLVEKPMAPSLAECDAMIAAARESGRVLSVVAQNRFRDDLALVKAAVESGLLGPVAAVQVDSAWWRGTEYYDLDWRGTWESEGGGPTLNHAIHHLDLVAWLLDASPQAVAALMTNAWHDNSEVEDLSVAILQYPRALATVTASVVHHGQQQRFVVQGRDAVVELPWAVRSEVPAGSGHPSDGGNAALIDKIEALRAGLAPLEHTGHAGQIGDVLAAVTHGRAPAVTGEAGRRTVEIVTAIYRAAIERRAVDLPIAVGDPWYGGEALLEHAPRYFTKTGYATALPEQTSARAAGWEQ